MNVLFCESNKACRMQSFSCITDLKINDPTRTSDAQLCLRQIIYPIVKLSLLFGEKNLPVTKNNVMVQSCHIAYFLPAAPFFLSFKEVDCAYNVIVRRRANFPFPPRKPCS